MKVPELNATYNYFDDGKITESRLEKVRILKLIKFEDAKPKLLKKWQKEVQQCNWLYNPETDFFVKGYLETTKEKVIFVRCKRVNGWFSLGWNAGRLDIDGTLALSLTQN